MKSFSKIWVKGEELPDMCSECPFVNVPNCTCAITNELLEEPDEYAGDECPLRNIYLYELRDKNYYTEELKNEIYDK